MKIYVLVENTTQLDGVTPEHGLSLYIEFQQKKILFDMGSSDLFLKNAEKLELNLKKIDFALLSHGHYDHGGGLFTFLSNNENALVYMHKNAFGSYYSKKTDGSVHYIGLDQTLAKNPRICFTETDSLTKLEEGVELFSNVTQKELCSKSNETLFEEKNGELATDTFTHEQNLILTEDGKTVLITGCSHNGIFNILMRFWELKGFWPDFVLGGFHLSKPGTDQSEAPKLVHAIAEKLLETGAKYYTCHCTGEQAFSILKEDMGEKLHPLSSGMCISL